MADEKPLSEDYATLAWMSDQHKAGRSGDDILNEMEELAEKLRKGGGAKPPNKT